MAEKQPILDASGTKTGQIIGNGSHTVLLDGKPLVLEGSVNSAGASVLKPPLTRTLEVEGRLVAYPGDALSDGSIILSRGTQNS